MAAALVLAVFSGARSGDAPAAQQTRGPLLRISLDEAVDRARPVKAAAPTRAARDRIVAGAPAIATAAPVAPVPAPVAADRKTAVEKALASGSVQQWREGDREGFVIAGPVREGDAQGCREITVLATGDAQGAAVSELKCAPQTSAEVDR